MDSDRAGAAEFFGCLRVLGRKNKIKAKQKIRNNFQTVCMWKRVDETQHKSGAAIKLCSRAMHIRVQR
jgi:hypothetical protein